MALLIAGATNAEAAEELGVSLRTVERRRAAWPELNEAILAERARQRAARPPPAHGTRARYLHHRCRCALCTRAHTEYARAYRSTRGKPT